MEWRLIALPGNGLDEPIGVVVQSMEDHVLDADVTKPQQGLCTLGSQSRIEDDGNTPFGRKPDEVSLGVAALVCEGIGQDRGRRPAYYDLLQFVIRRSPSAI